MSGAGPAADRSGVELLEQEPARLSRRALVVVGVLALLLAGGWVLDRRAHAAEATRVSACRDAAGSAQELADRRVSAMASYVRPALGGDSPSGVREGLTGLVADAASRAAAPLEEARAACAAVDVRPWHGDLRGGRADCLDALASRLAWLQEVAQDGAAAFRTTPRATAGCGPS